MTASDTKKSSSTDSPCPSVPSPGFSSSTDFSPFLNWDEDKPKSKQENAVVFWSLVATVKYQHALADSLEAKAVKFLDSVTLGTVESIDDLLTSLALSLDESLTDFVRCIEVLISSASKVITAAAMKMLKTLITFCSARVNLTLVKADLIPQLIITLNPMSLSFAEAEDIHTCLISAISSSLWLSTPDGLALLKIEDRNEQQAVHETVLQQVLVPSENYISHMCVNRLSLIDGQQALDFLFLLLARFIQISPSYQPTMEIVLHLPVVLTIPSCLAFFETDRTMLYFLYSMGTSQREWNKQGGGELNDMNEELVELRTTMYNMAKLMAEQFGKINEGQLEFDSVLRRLDEQERLTILHESRFQRWSKTGADAIEIFDEDFFIKTGDTFTLRERPENEDTNFIPKTLFSPIISSDVTQLSFTITHSSSGYRFGAISPHLVDTGTEHCLSPEQTSRACWGTVYDPPTPVQANVAPPPRQTLKYVMETDCRVGQRTLKLLNNGAVHSSFYVNLSLPFRFAINLHHSSVSVTVESLTFTAKPTLNGGENEIKFLS
ncbi:hypothetical protein BLNAU_11825 [Blattamonas nauphoetae]|uniref:Uncharacterized protein n=1 Tax=Blattamonas nauphoetae TaxID=2049346 RepID=A0ABQ9XS49_9EUKA|nr:hypothetical protein BLNAU_11825 [Blattamonas nauphoetae]